MDSMYYDTPCTECKQGILRTGKRGRPPKKHADGNCPTVNASATITDSDNVEPIVVAPDEQTQAVEEFLRSPAPPARSVLVGMHEDRMPIRVSKLVKGNVVLYQRAWVTLKDSPKDDGPNHVVLKFKEGGMIRVYKDGNAFIPA